MILFFIIEKNNTSNTFVVYQMIVKSIKVYDYGNISRIFS